MKYVDVDITMRIRIPVTDNMTFRLLHMNSLIFFFFISPFLFIRGRSSEVSPVDLTDLELVVLSSLSDVSNMESLSYSAMDSFLHRCLTSSLLSLAVTGGEYSLSKLSKFDKQKLTTKSIRR